MPNKRDLLEALGRNELLAVADTNMLIVTDRRRKEALVDALARATSVKAEEFLAALPRDRLKELCRRFDLDDGRRTKAEIIERLVNRDTAPPTNGKKSNVAPGPAIIEAVDLASGEMLTIERLERYLWSAADILRGSIDSSDYKGFIFGFLFLKRLSDRFGEETEALRGVPNTNPEDPDEHDFFVPKRARWPEIQKAATGVGEVLNKAAAALEEANPKLEGVLAGINFNDERKLGDSKNRDVVLGKLVQHFAKLDLRNANLSEPDMLGRAYEYLIERFADDAGKKGGEFYTPKMVVKLLVELLQPREGMRIYDPTCGSGGMLIECAHYLERQKQNPRNLSLFGQEKNLGTWAICKMNVLLHGLADARIEKGDTIRDPKLRDKDGLMLFDRVIANPPFSLDEWGREAAENDPWSRFQFGIPPKTKGDFAFVQHMLASTTSSGVVGVVLPHGVLFRGSSERDIRRALLLADRIEAVIGLAPNLFYGAGIPAAILILNRRKVAQRRGRVLFIHAAEEMVHGSAQNTLSDVNIARIVGAFSAFSDEPRFSRVVAVDEIENADWTLNITRFIDLAEDREGADLEEALRKLQQSLQERAQTQMTMDTLLEAHSRGSR